MDDRPPANAGEPPARDRPAGGAPNEDDDLDASLVSLSRLATGQMELGEALTRVAEYAVAAIPGADGAGLALIETGLRIHA